jgi:hypothetical protein
MPLGGDILVLEASLCAIGLSHAAFENSGTSTCSVQIKNLLATGTSRYHLNYAARWRHSRAGGRQTLDVEAVWVSHYLQPSFSANFAHMGISHSGSFLT